MQLLTVLTTVATLLSTASASSVAVPKKFHLKTALKPGQTNTAFDGLYVQTYHVGAGFNAAVLTSSKKGLPEGYINSTTKEVNFIIGGEKRYPGRLLFLDPYDTESGWAPTQINTVVEGTKGFELTKAGKLVNKRANAEFGGWRGCFWNHAGVPELFHDIGGFGQAAPAGCALVDLIAEGI